MACFYIVIAHVVLLQLVFNPTAMNIKNAPDRLSAVQVRLIRTAHETLWYGRFFKKYGEGGIRTHGGLHLGGFQDRCLKPLDHLSR
jgi:hypothetical protein